jgi:hypothetical protein
MLELCVQIGCEFELIKQGGDLFSTGEPLEVALQKRRGTINTVPRQA